MATFPQPGAVDTGAVQRAASSAGPIVVAVGVLALAGVAALFSRCGCAHAPGARHHTGRRW